MNELIWRFETRNLIIQVEAQEELDPDLSWDPEIGPRIDDGEFVLFSAKASVIWNGNEIATDYLGNCIYRTIEEFRDHIGIKKDHPGCGSYFSDMVREVLKEAREYFSDLELPNLRHAA